MVSSPVQPCFQCFQCFQPSMTAFYTHAFGVGNKSAKACSKPCSLMKKQFFLSTSLQASYNDHRPPTRTSRSTHDILLLLNSILTSAGRKQTTEQNRQNCKSRVEQFRTFPSAGTPLNDSSERERATRLLASKPLRRNAHTGICPSKRKGGSVRCTSEVTLWSKRGEAHQLLRL